MGQVSIYRVENPEEMVGQRLACVVTEVSRERQNLVLSHRAVMERERGEQREKMLAELAVGQLREGVEKSQPQGLARHSSTLVAWTASFTSASSVGTA